MKFVVIGAALSGNKGAAAMLESSIQTLGKKYPDATFTLLSLYPKEDAALNTYKNLTVLPATPLYIGLALNPLAAVYRLLPPLRKVLLRKSPQLKAIIEADALLDESGISFVDGREKFLSYNVATLLPAVIVGTKVIKCAQALGPFKNRLNKFVSRLFLPKMSLIIARGESTYSHLGELNLKNVVIATDYAFSLEMEEFHRIEGRNLLKKYGFNKKFAGKTVGISPSNVVAKKCAAASIDYERIIGDFINKLLADGCRVLLIPHSVRSDPTKLHNNDMPLCQRIDKTIKKQAHYAFVDQEVSSQTLRYIIGACDLFIACRFHAMISSLAGQVPTLVIGWSHKYNEILALFECANYGIDASKLSLNSLETNFKRLDAESKTYKRKLKNKIDFVKNLSKKHVELI